MDPFYRIQRLPPYVFNIVNELKYQARSRGEDILIYGRLIHRAHGFHRKGGS